MLYFGMQAYFYKIISIRAQMSFHRGHIENNDTKKPIILDDRVSILFYNYNAIDPI